MKAKQNNVRFPQNVKNKNSIIDLLLKLKNTSVWVILLFLTQSMLYAQSYGTRNGVQQDTYIINNDNSDNRAVLRLQDKYAAYLLDYGSNKLNFKFVANSDHNNYVGSNKMSLDRWGNVDVVNKIATKNYNIYAGNGNGISFWNDSHYKIHMGKSWKYHFGDVTDYAIKMNMNDDASRGWVWGVKNKQPIAALNTQGNMKLKGNLDIAKLEASKGILSHDHLNLNGAVGQGLRFWDSDNYKIHMGYDSNYNYGPVTDWAIKMNMSDNASRGWVWGVNSKTPIAALNTQGNMKLKGNIDVASLTVGTDIKIDGALAHFDGRVYISEENGTEEGFGSKTEDNYKDYLLWVEEGIVSSDFALAELTEWPDYVFYNDYKLPSLANVEKNIKENGHLHTMPSAKEVEENGFTVKDMTKRVVKTIEELTLHTIAQEKQIEAQNKLIEKLSKRLEKLEQANK